MSHATCSDWLTSMRLQMQVEQMGGADAVVKTPLCHIPHPQTDGTTPSLQTLGNIALQRVSQHPPVQPQGDAVTAFGEAAAASGFLGRFPGSQIMPLIQQVLGVATHE